MTKYSGHIKGDVILSSGDDISELISVGGTLTIHGGASLPALMVVGRSLTILADASLPMLTSVGGSLHVYADTSLPALTSVGGDFVIPDTWIGPLGNDNRYTPLFRDADGQLIVRLGCFRGTVEEAVHAIREKYGDGSKYEAAILIASKETV